MPQLDEDKLETARMFVKRWDDDRIKETIESAVGLNKYEDEYKLAIKEEYKNRFQVPVPRPFDVPTMSKITGIQKEIELSGYPKYAPPPAPPDPYANKIKYCHNRFGHIEIWKDAFGKGQSDIYLQTESDVAAFLEQIGIDPEELGIDTCDVVEDPGYFD